MAYRLVIRIVCSEGEATDWVVQSEIVFRDVLDVISRVSPQGTATAFEYEDEDGDRITVRSDDELKAMLSFFSWVNSHHVSQGLEPSPIIIYPRGCRTPSKRNIYGLTVNTKAAPSCSSTSQTSSSNSTRNDPGDLETMLRNGQVCNTDLRYLEVLGYGNGGTVYRSLHIPTNKVMAVKVIPLDVTPEVQKQIMSELDILFKCESSCIIEFYGAFFVENRISMCTEFMDGGSLDVYGFIPEPVLGRITVAVVKGLVYLWELKVMHRDVKPSNILVNTLGQVKLCDFGVSTQLVSSIATTYVGTNAYMAPERILGDEYGVYSEVWSLGISLLEMALGKFPYPSDGPSRSEALLPIELLQCIVHENPPTLPPDKFSPPFVDFIAKCLQKVPKSRPTPECLLEHHFIRINADDNTDMISMWVCRHLEQLKSHQQTKTENAQMNGAASS